MLAEKLLISALNFNILVDISEWQFISVTKANFVHPVYENVFNYKFSKFDPLGWG